MENSLGKWLKENDRLDIVDRWDSEKNQISIDNVYLFDKKRYFIKCPRGLHESELFHINLFHRKQVTCECRKCKSLAQGLIDMYGKEAFEKMWSKDNIENPWMIGFQTKKKFIFNCLTNSNHIYKQSGDSKASGYGCPLCNSTSIVRKSLLDVYPSVIDVWSDKNSKLPYEYSSQSGQKVWFKCRAGIHSDSLRRIASAAKRNFDCPICAMENIEHIPEDLTGKIFGELTAVKYDLNRSEATQETFWECKCSCGVTKSIRAISLKNGKTISCGAGYHHTGENNNAWKGGITPQTILARNCSKYDQWRDSVYAKDWYTCQCCGATGYKVKKQAHHILSFAHYEDKRYDVNNGITLCNECHYSTSKGSLHNVYGTNDVTPKQLEDYINNRRKSLGIDIPFSLIEYQNGNCLKPIKKENNYVG